MDSATQFFFVAQVVAAMLLSGMVGLEREFAEKPAGVRTHMLMGGASAFLVLLGSVIVDHFNPASLIASDPIRIIQAIVVGVSFLGAGTIFKNPNGEGDMVEGLTTGASLLTVAAIGIAIALELWWLALGVTAVNLLVNLGVDNLATRLKTKITAEHS